MSTRPSPDAWVRHALWLGGLLVVLAGLFAMHGLDTHAVESAGHVAMAGAAADGDAGHGLMSDTAEVGEAAKTATTRAATGAVTGAVTGAAVASAHGDMAADMGMGAAMCMAVLVLGLLALVLLIGARRSRQLVALVARRVRVPQTQGRDPDPPCLIRLSIQRC